MKCVEIDAGTLECSQGAFQNKCLDLRLSGRERDSPKDSAALTRWNLKGTNCTCWLVPWHLAEFRSTVQVSAQTSLALLFLLAVLPLLLRLGLKQVEPGERIDRRPAPPRHAQAGRPMATRACDEPLVVVT